MSHFNFKMKVPIECREGPCGKVAGVVLYPEAQEATDLIVETGFLPKRRRIVPLYLVAKAGEESVYLALDNADELERYPEYNITEYEEPASGLEHQGAKVPTPYGIHGPTEMAVPMVRRKVREGIVPGQRVLEEGMPVKNLTKTIGNVEHVFVDRDNGQVMYLVSRGGLIFRNQYLIPTSMIDKIDEEYVLLAGADEDLDLLPHYTPDHEEVLMTREKAQ